MRIVGTKAEAIEELRTRGQKARDNARSMSGTAKAKQEGRAEVYAEAAWFVENWELPADLGDPGNGHQGEPAAFGGYQPGPRPEQIMTRDDA
jgi:hypothetical protein